MKHFASPEFWELYRSLPQTIQDLADRSYALLKNDPRHPSLHLKKTVLFTAIFLCVTATPTKAMIESDRAVAVVFATVHVEKCKADQPSMQTEIDAAFSLWKQRNQKHIAAAESRADFKDIEIQIRALFNNKGSLPVSDCQLLIQRAKSPESDIDTKR